ncbi:MAG TPA: hypothetical protein VIL72_12145 [Beijerinckiaceae bacterium]
MRLSALALIRLAVLAAALAGLWAFLRSGGSADRAAVAEIERDCRRAHGARDPEVVQRCMIAEAARRRLESRGDAPAR